MKDHPPADTLFRDIGIVAGCALLFYVITNITPLTVDTVLSGQAFAAFEEFISARVSPDSFQVSQGFFLTLKNVMVVLGLFFIGGSFWAYLKAKEIHHHEHEKYEPIHLEEVIAKEKLIHWQVVLDHINSESPAEWKLAVLEADNILDEILEDQGYVGETVAEKLKGMSRTKIASYDALWDAHKLRNQIAHGETVGTDLSKKTARDAITKFENAFKDLGYL